MPAAVDRPEYSSTVAPTSALALGLTVSVGRVPPPAVIGALHTLISVLSAAVKCVSSVYVLPAESVTADAVAPAARHTPTSTTIRFPAVTFAVGCTASPVVFARFETCWTKAGGCAPVASCAPATTSAAATRHRTGSPAAARGGSLRILARMHS